MEIQISIRRVLTQLLQLTLLLLLSHSVCEAQHTPSAKSRAISSSTLDGKLIMGYQGWFGCPEDAQRAGWSHWFTNNHPSVEMLPDLSEVDDSQLCETNLVSHDGRKIKLYSRYSDQVTDLHFKWMEEYGLDGVAVQRFAVGLVSDASRKVMDDALERIVNSAERHGRVLFVMYDLTGLHSEQLPLIKDDWERLAKKGIPTSPGYLHHKGAPLVGLWGLGFSGRQIGPADAKRLIESFGSNAGKGSTRPNFLLGVPAGWRLGEGDASSDPAWNDVWKLATVLNPWTVGRYRDLASADRYRDEYLKQDAAVAKALGVDYMPTLFPGFSWSNLMRAAGKPEAAIRNQIPRDCGRFFWRQVYNALRYGADMLYVAMFDEVDEGTAIFKTASSADQVPGGGTVATEEFLTLDADGCRLPSDWYLRLTSEATKELKENRKPSLEMPFRVPN